MPFIENTLAEIPLSRENPNFYILKTKLLTLGIEKNFNC
jgi:hypothetical protein